MKPTYSLKSFLAALPVFLGFVAAIATLGQGQFSESEETVLSRAKGREPEAILELGKVERLSEAALAELKNMSKEDNKGYGSAAVYARMVLAKRGDTKYFDEIKNELLDGTPYEQVDAFEKLAYIGGAESVKLVAPFLDRADQPIEKGPRDKVFFPGYSKLAAVALGKMIDQPPSAPPDVNAVTARDVALWRQWWRANRSRYN